MKAVILKPIVWNTQNYQKASGHQHGGGFAMDYGYGHEEWNNRADWVWRNWKVFHTEPPKKLLNYSASGDLGMILIAANAKKQYAVGVAANVFDNSKEEREIISKELNVYNNWNDVWSLSTVKKCFDNDQDKFLDHWNENYEWIRWKCPQKYYYAFEKPILLNPKKISGKQMLVAEHGSFQGIYPVQAIDIIKKSLPSDHQIIEWLSTEDFDETIIGKDLKEFRKNKRNFRKVNKENRTNSNAQRSFKYWVEGNREVEPLHALLQAKYTKYLTDIGVKYEENQNYIDVQCKRGNQLRFIEIKPTENVQTRYAIRSAIGQLLEYQFLNNSKARLEIVLGNKPLGKEIKFVASLGIFLTYFDKKDNTFKEIKP